MSYGGSSDVFGNEKDDSFKGSIGAIYQTFAGQEVYPSLEEKAANLLYFITKNHSFSDGNGRTARLWHTVILSQGIHCLNLYLLRVKLIFFKVSIIKLLLIVM